MIKVKKSNLLQRVDASSLTLEGALFLVICSDITGDMEVIPVKPSRTLAGRIGNLGSRTGPTLQQLRNIRDFS